MREVREETILRLFADCVARSHGEPALWIKQGEWTSFTWEQVARDVLRAAAWLERCGIAPGDRVVQLAENRHEWIICDLAIHAARAIHVPIHAPLTGPQVAYQIRDSGAQLVIVSTPEQARKLASVADELPQDLRFFTFDEIEEPIGVQRAASFWQALPDFAGDAVCELTARAATADTNAVATILYTSGTTGEPKGVLLTNRNLASNAVSTVEAFGLPESDLRLGFLPLSHIFARTCDLYTWFVAGSELALAESRESVLADCAAVRPTILNGVPYFYDKVMRHLVEQGQQDEPGALQAIFGGRIRVCCSGGAALPDHVYDFYQQRGLPLLQGYGLTESSPVITLSSESATRRGAVGRAIRDVEIQIAADSEILTRGPHVMVGYYQRQAATDEVLRDGWLHTGDLGRLDEDNFLFITGRKKELIVTSGGKNISPVYLESLLTEDPLILQAVVIGDGRKFLSALIVPDPDVLRREIMGRRIAVTSPEQALQHPQVLQLYQERIAERLESVSYYEQVQAFRLLNRGFTIESGELTPKMSLRRDRIAANCRQLIDAMYPTP